MSDLVAATVEWLAATGAPNGLVLLAFITHPSTWSDAVVERVRPVLDRFLPTPAGNPEGAKKPPDEGGGGSG